METKYFDVDGFLGDYKNNQKKLKFLKSKHQAIADTASIDYSIPRVSGGSPSSSVESKAARREKIAQDIAKLNTYFEQYDELTKDLSSQEMLILNTYFRDGKKTRASVDLLAQELGFSATTMYRKIKMLRKKIRARMSGE